jgi:hypothetical protein
VLRPGLGILEPRELNHLRLDYIGMLALLFHRRQRFDDEFQKSRRIWLRCPEEIVKPGNIRGVIFPSKRRVVFSASL